MKRTTVLKNWFRRCLTLGMTSALAVSAAELEKEELKLALSSSLTWLPGDCLRKGFFEDEGLYVTQETQANWKVLLDRALRVNWMARTCSQVSQSAQRLVSVQKTRDYRVQHGPQW